MKRLLSLFCALLLAITVFPVSAANGASGPTVTISSVGSCHPGDEITLTVTIEDNPGIAGIRALPLFPDVLTLKSATRGTVLTDFSTGKSYQWYTSDGYNDNSDGTLVTLVFTVNSDAAGGTYDVSFDVKESMNEDGEDVELNLIAGKVTIDVPVTGISVDPTQATVLTGQTVSISALIEPDGASNKNVVWASSDESVATVEDGVVTGVKEGTVTITATSAENTSLSATCQVTVNCSHINTTTHQAKTSTCIEQGNEEYVTCDDCGAVVSGSDAKLPLADHTGGTATCEEKAKCEICGEEYGDYADHDLEKHDRVEATHLAEGNIEYYQCKVCKKYFSDAAGQNEITEAQTVISQIPHSFSESWEKDDSQHWHACDCGVKADAADHTYDNDCDPDCNVCGYERTITHQYSESWTTDGSQHWHECTVCGDRTDIGDHTGGSATCEQKAKCETCGAEYGDYAAHNYTENPTAENLKSEATCKEAAVYYKSCSVCGAKSEETFTYGEVNAENHTGETYVKDNKDATCTAKGYTGDTYCSDCDALIEKGTDIDMLAHTESDWQTSDDEHWKICTVCENEIEGSRAAHTAGDWIVDNEAGVGVAGSRHKECETCHKVLETEEIPALKEYHIIEGASAEWTKNASTGQSFTSDAEYDIFESVLVDGNTVATSNYTASEGSTKVDFTAAYMNTLSAGKHTLVIKSEDGLAQTDFTVIDAGPDTGYAGRDMILVPLMMISLCVIAFVLYKEKRRQLH